METDTWISAEYSAIVNTLEKIVAVISIDLTTVSLKLFVVKLIPSLRSNQIQTKEEEATQIMERVLSQIKVFPEKFETFLAVLNEIPSMQDLAKLIRAEYEKIQKEGLQLV